MGQLTVSAPPLPLSAWGGQPTVLIFEKGEPEKNECPGDLKRVSTTDICLRELTMFLVKKDFIK